jgi:hypothetical protein
MLCLMFLTFAALVWLMRRPPPANAEVSAH